MRKAFKWRYVVATLIFILGAGFLYVYDTYLQPYIFSKEVVKIKTDSNGLPKHYEISSNDVYLDSVPADHAPSEYFSDVNDVVGKKLNTMLSNGMILTAPLLDTENLMPGPDEGIFPIPKDAIYAINGSLRAGDRVDLYLVKDPNESAVRTVDPASGEEIKQPDIETSTEFSLSVPVAYVRTDDNNDVKDTEEGKSTNRSTSTGRVATPELLLKKESGKELGKKLGEGYSLWIVRVE